MINRRIFSIQVGLTSAALAVATKEAIAAGHAGAPSGAMAAKPASAASSPKAADAPAKGASATAKPAAGAGATNMVTEKDANAVGLGYKADATTVDKAKNKNYAAGQNCGSCALFQGKAGDAAGGCPLFAGKQVSAKGWCTAYAKKA